MGKIRLLWVDDDAELLEALRCFVDFSDAGVEIVAETGDGNLAIELARRLCPDVVVTDIDHPGADGFELTERVLAHAPEVGVPIYSAYGAPADVKRAVGVGARGYVVKGVAPHELIRAIETIAAGGTHVA